MRPVSTRSLKTSALTGLRTEKQRQFVLAYIGEARFNATEAARLAKYDGSDETLRAIGYENLTKPHIRAAIDEILEEHAITERQAVAIVSSHARASIGDFIDIVDEEGDDGNSKQTIRLNLMRAQEAGLLHLIKKVGHDSRGRPYIELVDAQAALKDLLAYYARRGRGGDDADLEGENRVAQVFEKLGIKLNHPPKLYT